MPKELSLWTDGRRQFVYLWSNKWRGRHKWWSSWQRRPQHWPHHKSMAPLLRTEPTPRGGYGSPRLQIESGKQQQIANSVIGKQELSPVPTTALHMSFPITSGIVCHAVTGCLLAWAFLLPVCCGLLLGDTNTKNRPTRMLFVEASFPSIAEVLHFEQPLLAVPSAT